MLKLFITLTVLILFKAPLYANGYILPDKTDFKSVNDINSQEQLSVTPYFIVDSLKKINIDYYLIKSEADNSHKKALKLVDKKFFRSAIIEFKKAQKGFSIINDQLAKANTTYHLAVTYHNLEETDNAINEYKAAQTIFNNEKLYNKLSNCYTNLGVIYDSSGDYSNAMFNYIKAFEINKANNNYKDIPTDLNNIGNVFSSLKINNKAIDYLNKGLIASIKYNDTLSLAYTYVNLGNVYINLNNHKIAEDYIQKAINLLKNFNSNKEEILSLAYTDLGRINIYKQDFKLAQSYLVQANKLALEEKLIYPRLYSLAYLIELNKETKNYKKAELFAEKALKIIKIHKMIPLKIKILSFLKEVYAEQGKYEKAYKIQEDVFNLNKKITYETHVKNVSELSSNLDYKQKKKISDQLNNAQKTVLKEKLEKQNLYLIISLIIVFFLIIIAIISIKNHINQKRVNNALLLKNEEIEKNRLEINKQSEILTNINNHKDQIFTIISHDLRKPIAHLTSILELLENNLIEVNDLQALIPNISKNVKDTSQVLDSLLVWAKSQLKGFNLKFTESNLHDFVNSRTQTLQPFIEEKNIQIINLIPKNLIFKIDALLTTIIIRNIILNSIKFSQEGQKIFISIIEKTAFYDLSITDEGIGMSEEQLAKLFTIQTKSTLGTNKERGTGLGLIFCKDLIQKSGGNLKIESKVNFGTKVTISLPKI